MHCGLWVLNVISELPDRMDAIGPRRLGLHGSVANIGN